MCNSGELEKTLVIDSSTITKYIVFNYCSGAGVADVKKPRLRVAWRESFNAAIQGQDEQASQ